MGEKFGYSPMQVDRRIQKMGAAFPEATHCVPQTLINSIVGLPDPDDRHVVALAIHAHANSIVTENVKDFPKAVLNPHNLTVISTEDFLVNQFLLHPDIMHEKLDSQAAGIGKNREFVLSLLKKTVPRFCELCL